MRILLIHNKYQQSGGEDSVFWSESELLSRHGHEVEHLLYDNTTIKTLYQKIVSGLCAMYNPESARALKRKIRDFKPDVIHVHNFLPLVSPSVFFVAKKNEVPVVLTLHNYRLICPSATLFYNGHIYEKSIHTLFPIDAIWKGVYRHSRIQTAVVALTTAMHALLGTWKNKIDGYITLTEFAKAKFSQSVLSIADSKLTVKPNFVEDCGRGEIEREDFFLFVGRLTEEKGIGVLLKAASLFNIKFVIIGDGPLAKRVEIFSRKNPTIRYLGFQPKETVISYLKRCKALIFPSTWYEGFPVTILEAFSTGTPVITSNIGGMKEIVTDGVDGLHFEAGNENDLTLKVIELSERDDLAKRLSGNARLTYLNNYTPSKNYDQLMAVYKKAGKSENLMSQDNAVYEYAKNALNGKAIKSEEYLSD